jgi:hypothetical protein
MSANSQRPKDQVWWVNHPQERKDKLYTTREEAEEQAKKLSNEPPGAAYVRTATGNPGDEGDEETVCCYRKGQLRDEKKYLEWLNSPDPI